MEKERRVQWTDARAAFLLIPDFEKISFLLEIRLSHSVYQIVS